MTNEEAKTWLNELYIRTDITDDYGGMEDMQPYEDALNIAIKALEQEPKTWDLDEAREDFEYDVYNILHFLSTNDEANKIIDSFDRVTSGIKCDDILNKIKAEIEEAQTYDGIYIDRAYVLQIIDKYNAESEE